MPLRPGEGVGCLCEVGRGGGTVLRVLGGDSGGSKGFRGLILGLTLRGVSDSDFRCSNRTICAGSGGHLMCYVGRRADFAVPRKIRIVNRVTFHNGGTLGGIVVTGDMGRVRRSTFCSYSRLSGICMPTNMGIMEDCTFTRYSGLGGVAFTNAPRGMNHRAFRSYSRLRSVVIPTKDDGFFYGRLRFVSNSASCLILRGPRGGTRGGTRVARGGTRGGTRASRGGTGWRPTGMGRLGGGELERVVAGRRVVGGTCMRHSVD